MNSHRAGNYLSTTDGAGIGIKKDPGEVPGIKLLFRFQPVFLTGLDSCATGHQVGWFEDLNCGL